MEKRDLLFKTCGVGSRTIGLAEDDKGDGGLYLRFTRPLEEADNVEKLQTLTVKTDGNELVTMVGLSLEAAGALYVLLHDHLEALEVRERVLSRVQEANKEKD